MNKFAQAVKKYVNAMINCYKVQWIVSKYACSQGPVHKRIICACTIMLVAPFAVVYNVVIPFLAFRKNNVIDFDHTAELVQSFYEGSKEGRFDEFLAK